MAWVNLIVGFIRLKPWALALIAVAVLGAGILLQVKDNEREALKAAALIDGAPAAVDIADFDRDQDATALREVVVRAQPVWDYTYELTLTSDSGDDHVLMIPLVSATTADDTKVVGIAYFDADNENFDNITNAFLDRGTVGLGKVSQIIEYNGRLGGMGKWDELTQEAFDDYNLVMRNDIVVIWPYVEGREVALAPRGEDDWTMFGVFSKLAGAIGLLALAKLVMRKTPDAPMPQPQFDAAQSQPMMAQPAMAQPEMAQPAVRSDVPLWKQRAGLVHEEPQDLSFVEPTPQPTLRPVAHDPLVLPARKPFGLRKVLIGIVGAAFVFLLAATVWSMVGDSVKPAQTAEIVSPQEFLAAGLADTVVPDADPNRRWFEIDVSPIAEWFVKQAVLAVTGDMAAITNLAMIAGAVFALIVLLPMYFRIRRSLQPRTTARFDSMGIN